MTAPPSVNKRASITANLLGYLLAAAVLPVILLGVVAFETSKHIIISQAEADNTRDFYLSDIPWDSYNVGRVDLQRGPNSILFGIGSPAGIVNSSLNPASFKDSNKVENRLDNYGSFRISADFNKVLLKDVALRYQRGSELAADLRACLA